MDEAHKPVERFWNFDIETDVFVMQGAPCAAPPPTPEIEQFRATVTKRLREYYQDLCMSKEGIGAPNESFNRWIMERKVHDKGRDPMLPTACADEVSPSMFREIMYDIPIRLAKIKSLSDARKQLFQYANAANTMIEARPFTQEARKLVKWHVEDTFSFLRKDQNALIDDYLNRLAHLRRQCGTYLADAAKTSVEDICRSMYHTSQEYSKQILDKHVEVLQLHNIEIPAPLPPSGRLELVRPIVMPCATPRVMGVTQEVNKRHVCLTYNCETMRLNCGYLEKLEHLYRISCKDDPKMELFLQRVWCLLRRYQTFFGPNQYEGIMLQGALPSTVFECLYSVFGVTMECFASPLNSYYKNYSSAFADTDCYFGSSGPLMQLFPVSGSFEVNPPFAEELMEAMVNHFEKLLAQSTEPLSFIIFAPEWRDPTPIAILRMEMSKFKRKQVLVPAFEHEYRSGLQHIAPLKEVYHKAVHGTSVFFLQNDRGFQKWGPTQERLRKLLTAFRPEIRKQTYQL